MAAPIEVLLTSETSGQLWNTCAWDLHSGTALMTYKGSSAGPQTLCLVKGDYLMTAVHNKPLIHVWALQRKDQMQMRIVCPGRVSAMTCSPDGNYCVAGIAEKIHIWQICTGNLLAVLSKHYQQVNCVRFTDDGSHFITAGEDNLVFVWSLASILSQHSPEGSTGQVAEPRYIWSQHSLPVTDVHVGPGGIRARVATASLDQTVKLWELCSGQLLCSCVFDHSITAVTMDAAEHRLFAGATNGNIYQVNLFEKPVQMQRHFSDAEDGALAFTGHSKQVSCLSVSTDGTLLASGSHDTSVKLWDICSRQCTRTIAHKGVLTNAVIVLTPPNMLNMDSRPSLPVAQFKRTLHQSGADESGTQTDRDVVMVRLKKKRTSPAEIESLTSSLNAPVLNKQGSSSTDTEREDSRVTEAQLREEIKKLKTINKQIYAYAVKELSSDADSNT